MTENVRHNHQSENTVKDEHQTKTKPLNFIWLLSSNKRKSKIRQNYIKKPKVKKQIRSFPGSLQKLQKKRIE